MIRIFNKLILSIFVSLCLIPNYGAADPYGIFVRNIERRPTLSLESNNVESITHTIACHDIRTGKMLDCRIKFATFLKEPYEGNCDECIVNNGGHTHNYDTYPFTQPKEFEDSTEYIVKNFVRRIPQVAGYIVEDILGIFPLYYRCISGCYTWNSWYERTNILVGIEGLQELEDPSANDHYVKNRNGEADHPEAFYGTPDTISTLKEIADKYYALTENENGPETPGRILSVNDMSLPRGGLFDIEADWVKPHKTHRRGTDVDINRAPHGQAEIL